ncbi:anaphase-promoting complex, cyclosome, subunit 4-domain-containing protein [Sparassis latifolia]
MDGNSFAPLAFIHLPSPARLLRSAWCPDKDLLVIVTRLGGNDRISLWKMQGSKKWEVDVELDSSSRDEVTGIGWSPDGQTIAITHDPPKVTLHSIQDGRLERTLTISPPLTLLGRTYHLTDVWWFQERKQEATSSIPDIFKRGDIITGSAHSILRGQPLLDHLQDESQPLTATDLFAFQGSHSRMLAKSSIPEVILCWPTLPPDPLSASIKQSKLGGDQTRPGEELDEMDDSNVNSVLVASDDLGHLHCYLDGSYPLGAVVVGFDSSATSLYKEKDIFFVHPRSSAAQATCLPPVVIQLPQLRQRILRDVARVSSSVRQLTWYVMRVVKDMREAWFGSDAQHGARELGPKWVRALEERQKDQFGVDEPHAMLDLTCLLTTGRASESLSDYLGSGEQMSERAIQKWESTMVDALIKLRDCSEKRVAPACQRLHLLLEEVHGWSQLSQYALFRIKTRDVAASLELTERAIVMASWLTATARRELTHFKEFMSWLKYETSRANSSTEAHTQPPPKHDMLEVNDYLMSGLVVSPIDKWFMGPVPRFSPQDIGVLGDQHDLTTVLQRARSVLKDREQIAWQSDARQKDLSHLDRNLDSLIQELATRCQRIFGEAANGAARSAVVLSGPTYPPLRVKNTWSSEDPRDLPLRDRTVQSSDQPDAFQQYLVMQTPRVGERSYLCLARLEHARVAAAAPLQVSVAVLESCVMQDDSKMPVDVLNAEFFDDKNFIVVYRPREVGQALIATVSYSDLSYETIQLQGYVNDLAREGLNMEVMQRLSDGQLSSVPMPIVQARTLAGCKEGKVTLAVNGRVGRRVACVLDEAGMSLEIFDMEGEEDETDELGQ